MRSNKTALILFVVVIILFMFMTGCSGSNPTLCRQAVMDEMETYEVSTIPNRDNFTFIARTKDGAIWYVETYNSSKAKITAKTMLMPPTNVNTNK